jgi:hypothetical protein
MTLAMLTLVVLVRSSAGARSVGGVRELPRGGGAGGELFEAWRLPPKKVMRGVIVGGLVSQRVCTVFN